MVLMKNSANALAPSGVCWVASNGMSGGRSPRLALGPVVGTSAGILGCGGAGGPEADADDGDGDRPGATAADDVGPDSDCDGADSDGVGLGEMGNVRPEEVQAAHDSTASAANVPIHRTAQ